MTTKLMIDRFLSWPLPESLCSDPCASMPGYPHRTGTNLMTAEQAKAMLDYVLAAPRQPEAVADEREAFEAWLGITPCGAAHDLAVKAFQAGAAYQRQSVTEAARDVLAERQRQISAEGWTPDHDDEHDTGSLAAAAGCYAMYTLAYPAGDPHHNWPWDKAWWKPSADRRRNLVKAGALILAEIERLDRAALPPVPEVKL